ncbi:recombination directionality factor [Kitasatospora sp. NPDC004240]
MPDCSYLSATWPRHASAGHAASAAFSCPSGFAGHLRLSQPRNGLPDSAPSWVLTIHDRMDAANVCEVLRGSVEPSTSDSAVDLVIPAGALRVTLDGRDPVSMSMIRRSAGKTVHLCDGQPVLESTGRGATCGCPSSWDARRLQARAGRGPRPQAMVRFRLTDLPDVGVFEFSTTSWDFAEAVRRELDGVSQEGGSREGVIGIDSVRFPTRAGLEVSYSRPALNLGPRG